MDVFIVSGDHVPAIPFKSVLGNGGGMLSSHKVSICASNGTTFGIISIIIESVTKHLYDESGVK